MKTVIQRVQHASVVVDEATVGSIGPGLMVLVGIHANDTEETVRWMVDKICALRIFSDDAGKMNQSLVDVGGSILAVSQFTLYADCEKGNRPSFTKAASSEKGSILYEYFVTKVREKNITVATGIFGAHMEVSLLNDGPVTIVLERE